MAVNNLKISLAANYDPQLVPEIARYPVDEVYGKFPADGISGGRPRYMATPVSKGAMLDYVRLLDKHGIAFNYLINGSCMGNREWTGSWQRKIMSLLGKIQDMGIRRVTVSTPFLLELVKKRFPEFKVRVGIYAQVDTLSRAKFWEDSGADTITLESFSINRDFGRLASIRKSVKCDLQLIANHACLPNCPMQSYHQNGFAHASDNSDVLFIDYCFLRCSRKRLEDTSLFIKAGWIRPEDLGVYEELGYTTFKLLERGIPSSELLKRVKAYSGRQSPENLADLILSCGFAESQKKERFWALRNFIKPWQANPFKLIKLFELARHQGMSFPRLETNIKIDSRQIPADFIDGFRKRDCMMLNCKECGYCEKIAGNAVSVSPSFREESLKRYADIEDSLATGGLWGV